MLKTLVRSILGGVVVTAVLGAPLFLCAGRWDVVGFWAYVGIWAMASVVGGMVTDPTLARERLRPGSGGKDYLPFVVIPPLWAGQYVVAGLDVGRFHWSDDIPLPVQVIALAALAAALAVVVWAEAVNRFFSTVIRIQCDRGHHLITSGPYRFVRHPAYAACPFLWAGGGLALGSGLAALIGVLVFLPILRRTAQEDRVLREQLAGYPDYARQVLWRLFPGVW